MNQLTGGQRYTDAFWFVVPIPLLVAGATVAVSLKPSGLAVVALLALATVGAGIEVVLWQRLRASWARGERLSEAKVGASVLYPAFVVLVYTAVLAVAGVVVRLVERAQGRRDGGRW